MEAFQKNIDALDNKVGRLIQKWKDMLEVNKTLNDRNKKLEEELRKIRSDKIVEPTGTETDNNSNLHNIETELDNYIRKIDGCLELINIELDGK